MNINNKNPKSALYISPLLGGIFSLILFIVYYFILLLQQSDMSSLLSLEYWLHSTWVLIQITPLLLIAFCMISYLCSCTVGILLYKLKNYFYLSSEFFWLMSWFAGLFIGFICVYFSYKPQTTILQSGVILICFSFGALFNSSLFCVLIGDIKKHYKYKK